MTQNYWFRAGFDYVLSKTGSNYSSQSKKRMPSQGGNENSNCPKRGKRRVTEMRLLASDWLRG